MIHRRICPFLTALMAIPVAASIAQQPASVGTFRTLASFTGELFAADPHVSPDGRFVLLSTQNALSVYDVATKRTTRLVDRPAGELAWSPKLDRIAWVQAGDGGSGEYIWSMAIDPRTAAAKAPPQRVTLGQGEYPAISYDGKWIAYSAPDNEGPGATSGMLPHHLSVVPVTGGPERVLAHFTGGIDALHWSVDGKSIYLEGTPTGAQKGVVTKVYLNGRPPEVIRPGPGEWFAGMTNDRRHIVLVPAKNPIAASDRAVIIDTLGKEIGHAPLPVGSINEYDHVIGDTALVWVDIKDRRRVEIGSMSGGAPRRIPPVGESNEAPMWSPDGKQIAFQVRENKHNVLALMNADGSNVRVLHDTDVRPDQWGARWSPDSKSIGFSSGDWHGLMMLDVASLKVRTIVHDTSRRVGNWTWREDSKSIVAVMLQQPQSGRATIDEITVNGDRKPLFDPGNARTLSGFQFVGGSAVVYRTDSAWFLAPLGGGAPRRLAGVPLGTRVGTTVVSNDHAWFGGPLQDPKRSEYNQLELITIASGERKVIELPFNLGWSFQPQLTDDNRAMLVFGRARSDSIGLKLYRVPLNGDPPRAIANIGGVPRGAAVSLSPNGKSFVYAAHDSRTSTLLLVDLRPALSASSRSPR